MRKTKPAKSAHASALTGPNQKRAKAADDAVHNDGSFAPPQTVVEQTGTDQQNAHDTGSNLDAAARLADEREIGLPEPDAPEGTLTADEQAKRSAESIKAALKNLGSGALSLSKETAIRDALKETSEHAVSKGDPVRYVDDDGLYHDAWVDEVFRDSCSLRVPTLNPPRMHGVRMNNEHHQHGTFHLDLKRGRDGGANVQSFYGTPRERAHPFSATREVETRGV